MKNVVLILLMAFVSVGVHSQSVKTNLQKGVDFTQYETFTVMKGEFMTPPDERKVSEEKLFQSVKGAVIKELEARGYKHVEDTTAAQLRVSYVAGAYNLTDTEVSGPLGQTPASTPAEMNQARAVSRETREGMLVIDIADSRKKELWTATSNLTIDGTDITRALDAAIYKSFKKFPNKNKKKKKK